MLYHINTAETDSMSATLRRKIYFGFHTKHIVNVANLSLATKWILSEVMTQLSSWKKQKYL